ncbi:MAG: ATP-binding protein [Deltaproteobacteria bacterium]|jgi:Cdc6-like AAA superfamily ATPase|nr:ATP-binding protein [Deltaproteobacteria bacterium]
MKRDPWLIPDQEVPGAGRTVSLLHTRPGGWEIHSTEAGGRILVAKAGLMDRWSSCGLVEPDSVLQLASGDVRLKYFASPPRARLAPLLSRELPRTHGVASALASAFRKSRKLDPETSFAKALYSEHFGSVLPVPRTPPDRRDDELDFGTWLCEGLGVSTKSFTQLSCLVDYMSADQLAKVLRMAGFDVPESRRAQGSQGRSSSGDRPRGGRDDRDDRDGRNVRNGRDDRDARDGREGRGYRDGRDSRDSKDSRGRRDGDSGLPESLRWAGEEDRSRRDEKSRRGGVKRDPLPRRAYGPEEDKIFKLPGRRELQKFFNDHIVEIILSPDKYKKLGVDFPAATILHGPPGCGKTYAVDRLVEFIEWPVNYINSSSVASPFIHDTSKKISQVFDKAIKNAPSILVIDEMEAYLSSRHMANVHQHQVEEVGEFLRRIPDALDKKVLIIAMTNMIDTIDGAILRQGRFDYKIKIELPDAEEVKELMDHLMSSRAAEKDLDLAPAITALTKKPLSDAAFVMREAARLAARAGREAIDNASLAQALKNIPPAKSKKDIGFVGG